MEFQIGKWRFSPESNSLASGGKTQKLENRTARVLEFFCKNPDRVISRDELLDEVWGRHAISDHSVSIVISDLRKALGDSAKNSSIIKTVAKRGYVFSPPEAEQEQKKAPSRPAVFVAALASLAILAFGYFFLAQKANPETLVFYDLKAPEENAEGGYVAENLSESMLVELAKIPDLRVIRIRPPERPLTAGLGFLDRFLTPEPVSLKGSIAPQSEGFRLTLRMERGPEGEIIWGYEEDLVEDFYYLSGQRAVQSLGREMGWQTPITLGVENERAERLFWRAVYLWESRSNQNTKASHEALLEALEINPDFPRAHAQLATIYAHKTGPYLGFTSPNLFDRAEQHLAAAEQGGIELPEINTTKALIAFYRDRDYETALGHIEGGLEKWPYNALLWHTRGMVTSAMGQHDQSLFSIAKARELDPMSHSINWDRVWFLYLAGRYEEALEAADETGTFTSDIHYYYTALIYEALGNKAMALNQWLEFISGVGIPLPFPEVAGGGENINYPEKYKLLLDAVEADGRAFYPEAVKVFWAYLSGDFERTFALLETLPVEQENWVYYWLAEIPLLQDLKGQNRFAALLEGSN